MVAERIRAAHAANRDLSDDPPTPFQDCRDEVHIAVFFDGTGNNKDADEKKMSWSNIANLFESAYLAANISKSRKIYPIYISGVGTDLNRQAADWIEASKIWVEDNLLGLGAGGGGDRRMDLGLTSVNARLRTVLIANAKALGGTAAKHAAENSAKGFDEMSAALAKHRLIKVINLSIFGFSRGAALARAFSNQIVAKSVNKGDELLYQGYPLRLGFMGIFDTVASFGVPANNARLPFCERDLIVPPAVERCVHFVAAHELRFSFPVDLIRKNGMLAGNWLEKVFPGVHSDVGGGYAPLEQGIENNYARIPLREMLTQALTHGVRLLSYEDIKKKNYPFFQKRFECKQETEAAYARYLTAFAGQGQPIEQQIKAHMKLFYSANGTMSRRGMETAGDRSRSGSRVKSLLGPKGMAAEVAACRLGSNNVRTVRLGGPSSQAYAQYVRIQEWQLTAWDTTAPDGVTDFVSKYVHDSKVDFLLNAEPFSYFSTRGVDESSVSIWKDGEDWLRSKGTSVSTAAGQVVKTAEQTVEKAAHATTGTWSEAGDKFTDSVHELYESGTRWVQQRTGESTLK
jgi:hypothetical protein